MTENVEKSKSKPLPETIKHLMLYKIFDSNAQGFVMTRSQFDDITNIMEKRSLEGIGLWSVFFYPKSAHLAIGGMDRTIYPLVALSTDFEYYKWIHGPGFAKEWIKFAEAIEWIDAKHVLYTNKGPYKNGSLCVVDENTQIAYVGEAFVGGGRLYHEPSATECPINGTIVE